MPLASCTQTEISAGGNGAGGGIEAREEKREQEPDKSAEISALIGRLGDYDWRAREDAEKKLIAIGQAAEPLLRLAIDTHGDTEVRLRAERVLNVIPAEKAFRKALFLLNTGILTAARSELQKLVGIAVGAYAEKSRFLLAEIGNITRVYPGYDKGSTSFWSWYTQYNGEDRNDRIFFMAIAYNNIYLFLKAEGIESSFAFEKSEMFYRTIIEEETARKNRRPASGYAALLSAAGKVDKGLEALSKVENIPLVSWTEYFDVASFYTYAGSKAKALEYLNLGLLAAVETGYLSHAKNWARTSNDFQSLHGDDTFEKLVED